MSAGPLELVGLSDKLLKNVSKNQSPVSGNSNKINGVGEKQPISEFARFLQSNKGDANEKATRPNLSGDPNELLAAANISVNFAVSGKNQPLTNEMGKALLDNLELADDLPKVDVELNFRSGFDAQAQKDDPTITSNPIVGAQESIAHFSLVPLLGAHEPVSVSEPVLTGTIQPGKNDWQNPVFHRDVMPRYWTPFGIEPDNITHPATLDLDKDTAQPKFDGLKSPGSISALAFDWIKESKFQTLVDKREALSVDLKSTFSSILQGDLNSTSKSQEPGAQSAYLTSIGLDGREISTASRSLTTYSPAGMTETLNLKQNFTPNLALRVQWMFNQAMSSAEIMMDPPEMGPLSVRIQHHQGETSVVFHVANANAKELLDDSLPKLREMLLEQGINLGNTHVKQQGKGGSGSESNQGQADDRRGLLAEEDPTIGDEKVVIKQGFVDVYS